VAAYLIDGVAVGVASSILTIPAQVRMQRDLTGLMRELERQSSQSTAPDLGAFLGDYLHALEPIVLWSGIASFVVWFLYSSIMLRLKGATLGKMALGIGVRLRERPGQLPWSTVLLRALAQQWHLLTAFLPLVYFAVSWWPWLDGLWASWDRKKQALHDKVARTNVVRTR
jgi:uncharacterized RDD family membrane protein YckC